MSIDIEREDRLDSALSGQPQEDRLLQSAADSLRGYAVELKLSHILESGEWPDEEESAKAHHDHMMALAKGLDELRANRQGILDSSGCELKPCPFCGAKAEVKGGLEAQENYSVWCENLHHMDGGYDREKLVAKWNRRAIPAITPEMIEAGAQRLVAWEGDSEWPDSWSPMVVAAARNDAERVLRSALNVRADHIADDRKMVASERAARTQPEQPSAGVVPEGQAIGLLARVQGWWQNTDGDMPASLEQDIAALLTAAPTVQPVQGGGVPEWIQEISANLKTQDNRITADPLFVVFQKREIVTHEDFDYDRISWGSCDGEAPAHIQDELNELYDDVESDYFRDDEITLTTDDGTEIWQRAAIKAVDEFVTACFTEAGAKAYLENNGHNLRQPFIYVTSLYRNEEMKQLRDWLYTHPHNGEQGGEWSACCDKLPKIGQRVILKKDGVIQNYMPVLDECDDEGLFWDFEDATDYDPLVDMEFDEWKPAPQPPKSKEGES